MARPLMAELEPSGHHSLARMLQVNEVIREEETKLKRANECLGIGTQVCCIYELPYEEQEER